MQHIRAHVLIAEEQDVNLPVQRKYSLLLVGLLKLKA